MNRFWTGQGPRRANLHKWGLAQSPSCDCGLRQTTNHVVDMCPLTKFKGGLNLLYEADDDAVTWLESTANCSSRKIIINNVHRSQYLLDEWACLVRELLVRVTAIVAVAARAVTMKPDARPRLVVVAAAVGASAQARPVVGTQLWLLGTQRSAAVVERAFRALQRRQNIQFSSITTTTTTLHTFNGPLSGTTRVSRYQKGKTNPDFTEARDVEWQWHQLHLAPDRQPRQHPTTQFFTGRLPFLPPNQQRQCIFPRKMDEQLKSKNMQKRTVF